jgi:hypothetical protein
MDANHFDQHTRDLSAVASRRGILAALMSALLARRLTADGEDAAAKSKRKRRKGKNRRFVGCAPKCAGKSCGKDGCGGSCGDCGTGQICQGGACICPAGTELCGGACVALCPAPQIRELSTCGCCLPPGASCTRDATPCCSGVCFIDLISLLGQCVA